MVTAGEEVSQEEERGRLAQFPVLHGLVLIFPLEHDELDVLGLPGQSLPEHVDVGESAPHQDAERVQAGLAVHHAEGLDHIEHLGRLPIGRGVDHGQVAAGESADFLVDLFQAEQAGVAGEKENLAILFLTRLISIGSA